MDLGVMMRTIEFDGLELVVKSGEIETLGNGVTQPGGSQYAGITFADGEVVKNVIADAMIDPYLSQGFSGDFIFLRFRARMTLVAVDIKGVGRRFANEEAFFKIANSGWQVYALFYAISATLVYQIVSNVMTRQFVWPALWCVLLLGSAVFLWRLHRSDRMAKKVGNLIVSLRDGRVNVASKSAAPQALEPQATVTA